MQTVKQLVLLLAAWLMAPFRRSATTAPRKILVAQIAKMGDMICITPVFRELHAAFPEAEIHVLGRSSNRPITTGQPGITRFIPYAPNDFVGLLKTIRQERYDAAVCLSFDFYTLTMLLMARIPRISALKLMAGKTPLYTAMYRALLPLVATAPFRLGEYFPLQYLGVLRPLGINSTDTTKQLFVRPESDAAIDTYLNDEGVTPGTVLAIVCPGAGNKVKVWAPERFAAIADYLAERHHMLVVLCGGPTDREEVTAVREHLAPSTHYIVSLDHGIEDLKALVARATLLIAPDSGTIYIAEAFGKGTVTIIGPTDEREHPPKGPINRVVVAPNRGVPAADALNSKGYDPEEAARQIGAVTIDMVKREIDILIGNLSSSR